MAFGPLGSHDLGVNGGWASLAEAHTALGVVASGFFLRARLWYTDSRRKRTMKIIRCEQIEAAPVETEGAVIVVCAA